jgi:hypothetical protein
LSDAVRALATREGTTPFVLLLTAYQVLLHRYTGQNKTIVGTPTYGRDRPEFSNVAGYFVNMIPLKAAFDNDPTSRELLAQIRQTVVEGIQHQDYPFPVLVEKLQPDRDFSRTPIFQTVFILQKFKQVAGLEDLFTLTDSAARVEFGGLLLVNGPRQTVISGPGEDVTSLLAQFSAAGVKFRELVVSHAFHSPLMNPVLEPFERAAAKVSFGAPRIRLVSNLTGQVTSAAQIAQPAYWSRHIRETVRYAGSMQTVADAGCTVFVEIGPNPVLLGLGRGYIAPEGALWLASVRSGRDDWAEMLSSLSQLYAHGVEVDWAGFDRDYPRHKVSLPTYPFQRERYFVDRKIQSPGRPETPRALHPLAERFIKSPSLKEIVFETSLSAASHRFVADHRVFGRIVFPAIGYLESVRAAARLGLGDGNWAVENMVIGEPLALDDTETKRFQVVYRNRLRVPRGFKFLARMLARSRPNPYGSCMYQVRCAVWQIQMIGPRSISRR